MKLILSWCYKNITQKFPGTLLMGALVLSGFSVYLAADLKFNPKMDNLLPQDLPLIKEFNEVVKKTGGSGPLVVVLENLDPIQAPEVSLEVKSLLNIPGGPEEIYDIKPLEEYPLPWIDYLWIALAGLAILGLLYFIWFKWKSRPSPLNLSNSDTVLNPEQLAFKELEVLKKKQLLQIGKDQDHFFELSEIFRRYLENRYHFPAREWTTEEITAHFKNFSNLSDNLKLQARSILTQTDRVKFAKDERAEDEMPSIISFIHEAQPPITEAVNTT